MKVPRAKVSRRGNRPGFATAPALALTTCVLANEAWAGRIPEWSRFRGPNGSGVLEARNLPMVFGPTTNLAWSVSTPAGSSSPSGLRQRSSPYNNWPLFCEVGSRGVATTAAEPGWRLLHADSVRRERGDGWPGGDGGLLGEGRSAEMVGAQHGGNARGKSGVGRSPDVRGQRRSALVVDGIVIRGANTLWSFRKK